MIRILLSTCLAVELVAQAAPRNVLFTWQHADTATTLTVAYHSFGLRPLPAVVYWDTESRDGVVADYRFRAEGDRLRLDGLNDRWICRVPLSGLPAAATIYLVAGDQERGISREYAVRTLPDDDRPLRFIVGGDMGPGADTRTLLRQAARLAPDFALVGGDIAYANGNLRDVDRWDSWLSYWSEEMVTPDGRSIPVALAIGNHEVRGGYGKDPDHAPFYFGFLAQDPRSYFLRRFGAAVAVLLLDSGHVAAHGGDQALWLEAALAEHQGVRHRFVVYHVPLYPSHRDFDGELSRAGRQHWAPLFERHGVDIAFENHDHTWKRSRRLRAGVPAADGVLYLGDGCFGQRPRAVTYGGRWYLERQATEPHFWCVDVSPSGVVCRAIDRRGRCFDVHPEGAAGSAEAAQVFATLRPRLEAPPGALRATALPAGDPWQRGATTLAITNVFGGPCRLRIELARAPAGARMEIGPLRDREGKPAARAQQFPVVVGRAQASLDCIAMGLRPRPLTES